MNRSEHVSLFAAQHFLFIVFALAVESLTSYKHKSCFYVQGEIAHFFHSPLYLSTCLKSIFKENVLMLDL